MTTNINVLFSIDANFLCVDNQLSVELDVTNNLIDFNAEEQRTLVAFILSHYESIPALNIEPSILTPSEELNGKTIVIKLTQDVDGFDLDISGHELVMQGQHKANCAKVLHTALLDLESKFIKLAS